MAFGIVCEYNPFHNGHLHQIKEIKKSSDEPIICVMSGNFTQRGEIAIADKYTRAKMALSAGADIVLELPVPFCFSSAEHFARAGVDILHSVGVDKLSFGSESADAEKIMKIAAIAASPEFKSECEKLSRSEGNAHAYFDLLANRSGESHILSNDILAIEYAKEILLGGYSMELSPVKREGNAYRDSVLKENILPSATAIRERISSGDMESIRLFIPEEAFKILKESELASISNAGDGIILALRLRGDDAPGVAISDKGLVRRILSTAKYCTSFEELERELQTKKYTSSAIRRAILYILFDVRHDDLCKHPEYTVLLGANARGRDYLASIRKTDSSIKIITKPSDAFNIEGAERRTELSMRADALYTMCFDNKKENGYYFRKSPIIK